LAIDPGTLHSAYVVLHDGVPESWNKIENVALLSLIRRGDMADCMAIEMFEGRGMAAGAESFVTCVWIGRFIEAWDSQGNKWKSPSRRDVRLSRCGSTNAKDGNIRQSILDDYGGKEKAIGTKKTPGPLYGMKADVWQAFAVGLTYLDMWVN
jgi:hypothetical protein